MVTNDFSVDLESLQANLNFMRRTLGLSTKEFAEKLDIKPNSVWRWEKQGAMPQSSNLRLIVNLWNELGVPKIDIMTLTSKEMATSENNYRSRETMEVDRKVVDKGIINLGIGAFENDRRSLVTLKVTMDEMQAMKEIVSKEIIDYIDNKTWRGLLFALRESRTK